VTSDSFGAFVLPHRPGGELHQRWFVPVHMQCMVCKVSMKVDEYTTIDSVVEFARKHDTCTKEDGQ
jgi:hypothetical protein